MEEEPQDCEAIDLDNGYKKLYVDNMSIMYLFGSTVDLKKDVFGTVLEVHNPPRTESRGCGEFINFDMDMVESNMDSFFIPINETLLGKDKEHLV